MTFSPSIDPLLYVLLTLHCLIGSIAATIAYRKGRKLSVWLFLGLIGGTAALIVSLFLPSNKV